MVKKAPINVYEAAIKRIRYCFSEFDNVLVSFSGGKDSGVFLYEEPSSKFDFYEIHLKKPRDMNQEMMNLKCDGSMIADMGYKHLSRFGCMGSAEWVARALNLGFPDKYTITKLIEFAQET